MSDPVQNVEIEDVLSSIRRLVSGDHWTRVTASESSAPQTKPLNDPTEAAVSEKFVLTPVLRVVAPEDAPIPADKGAAAESEPQAENDPVLEKTSPAPQEMADSGPVNAMDRPDPVDKDDQPDPAVDDLDRVIQALSDDKDSASDDPAPEPELVAEDAEPDMSDADNVVTADTVAAPIAEAKVELRSQATSRLHLEATIAELEAAVGGQGDDWEPDGSESEATQEPAWTPPAARRAVAPDPAVAEDAQEIAHDDDEEITFHHVGPEFVSAEHLEDLAAGLGAGAAAYGAELDENLNSFMESESVIDEQMLRDLVADIVRQELQGVLGERITRNVRKLVRREIYRVLASQEFD